jgi:hypothetical protein
LFEAFDRSAAPSLFEMWVLDDGYWEGIGNAQLMPVAQCSKLIADS